MTGGQGWRTARALPLPEPGDVVTIKEADYCYGPGDIRLRLTVVGNGKPIHEGAEWVQVEGIELNRDDSERGPRSALVRASALVR